AARANDATGEREDDARDSPNGLGRGLGRGERGPRARAQDQEIASRHALGGSEDILARELAVHHRQSPVTPTIQLLADLKAVAEEAQVAADADRFLLHHR